ncbi:Hypothetical protein ING2D1G_0101 [Peptoniphilus sp. ING2-D1G]|nr:Hypothetical protein ING2D1G_0101 [Peptoniphilus sp. ING2-D1G]
MNKFMAVALIIFIIAIAFLTLKFIKKPESEGNLAGLKEAIYLRGDLFLMSDGKTLVNIEVEEELEAGQRVIYEGEGDNIEISEITDRSTGDKMSLETAVEVNKKTDSSVKLIDVREVGEFESGHVPGAINIPMGTLTESKEFTKDDLLILYCRSGARSAAAQRILEQEGYYVIDAGGIISYSGEIER